jgi:hypothetical protein
MVARFDHVPLIFAMKIRTFQAWMLAVMVFCWFLAHSGITLKRFNLLTYFRQLPMAKNF